MDHISEAVIAERLARQFHDGVLDRHGIPYIEHVEWVVDHVDEQSRAAAWLHDVLEDTDATVQVLRDAGISETTIATVVLLTRDKARHPVYMDMIREIAEAAGEVGRRGRSIKIADNQHNGKVRNPDPQLNGQQNTRYPRAEKILRAGIEAFGEAVCV